MTTEESPSKYKGCEAHLERKFLDKWKDFWKIRKFKRYWRNNPREEIWQIMNENTGENVLHYLAREGDYEFLKELCDSKLNHEDPYEKRFIFDALRQVDKFGDTPMLSAFNAPKNGIQILHYLLEKISEQEKNRWLQKETIHHANRNKDTILTKLTSYKNTELYGVQQDKEAISESKRLIYKIFTQYYTDQNPKCFYEIFYQIQQNISWDVNEIVISNILHEINSISTKDPFFDGNPSSSEDNVFQYQNQYGNNILMELATKGKDESLKELMSDRNTRRHLTHSILQQRNKQGETLLSMMEVNRAVLTESLSFVLRKEYTEFHKRNMLEAEQCISNQVDSSISAFQMIQDLNGVENSISCSSKIQIFILLILTNLYPTILLVQDIFFDSYLSIQYYNEWMNETISHEGHHLTQREQNCHSCTLDWKNKSTKFYERNENTSSKHDWYETNMMKTVECYKTCFSPESRFWYTTVFISLQLVFYLTEFLTLTDNYEITGMRASVKETWNDIIGGKNGLLIGKILKLIFLLIITTVVIILWMPLCSFIRIFSEYKFQTAPEEKRVAISKKNDITAFTAARSELIEVNTEASTEPIIQGYIIAPYLYDIFKKASNLIEMREGSIHFNSVDFTNVELTQLWTIISSILSLAWCYSEYHSVKKKYYLDIFTSPFSRILMFVFMLLLITSRLLLFQLFAFYFPPGHIYPIFIFLLGHMIFASILHIFFSDAVLYIKKGYYLKFIHNVLMNALGTIYFHNFFRTDETPIIDENEDIEATKTERNEGIKEKRKRYNIKEKDTTRPGLHFSTYERQKYFGFLYIMEFAILMYFGMSSYLVQSGFIGFTEQLVDGVKTQELKHWYNLRRVWTIFMLAGGATILILLYYGVLHIWKNSIFTSTRLASKKWRGGLRQYFVVSKNTWFLGELRTYKSSIMVLPEKLVRLIEDQFEKLQKRITDQIDELLTLFGNFKNWKTNLKSMGNCKKTLALVFGPFLVFLGIVITSLFIIILLVLVILSILSVFPTAIIIKIISKIRSLICGCNCTKDKNYESKVVIKFHYSKENNRKKRYVKWLVTSPEETKKWMEDPSHDPDTINQWLPQMKSQEEEVKQNSIDSLDSNSNKSSKILISKIEVSYQKPVNSALDPNINLGIRYDIFEHLIKFLPYTEELIVDSLLHVVQEWKKKEANDDERRNKALGMFEEKTKNNCLKRLTLQNCSIFTHKDLHNIKFAEGLKNLEKVDLSDNKEIHSTDLDQILKIAENKKMKKIVLKNAKLNKERFDEMLIELFFFLEKINLQGWSLSNTFIDRISAMSSSLACERRIHLKELDLRNCTLDETQVKKLHEIKSFGNNDQSIYINFGEHLFEPPKFDQKSVANCLMKDGILDLSNRQKISDEEIQETVAFTAKLNRQKYKLKILNLNNCNLSKDNVKQLTPLISQFHTVQLGGKQDFQDFPVGIKELHVDLYGGIDHTLTDSLNNEESVHKTDGKIPLGEDVDGAAFAAVTQSPKRIQKKSIKDLAENAKLDNIWLKRLEFNVIKVESNKTYFGKCLDFNWINQEIEEAKYVEERHEMIDHIISFIPYLDELVLDGFLSVSLEYKKDVHENLLKSIFNRSHPMKFMSLRNCNFKRLTHESIQGLLNTKEVDLSGNNIEDNSWENMITLLENGKVESKMTSFIYQGGKHRFELGYLFVEMLSFIQKIDLKGCQFLKSGVIDSDVHEAIWKKIYERPKPMEFVGMRDCKVKKLTFKTASSDDSVEGSLLSNEESIEGIFNIKEVDLSGNDIDVKSWEYMADFLEQRKGESVLSSLIFQGDIINTTKRAQLFAKIVNNIDKVDLKACQFIDLSVIESFVNSLNGTTHLDLTGLKLKKGQNLPEGQYWKDKLKSKGVCINPSSNEEK